jgi:bifunctional DNase/RNase
LTTTAGGADDRDMPALPVEIVGVHLDPGTMTPIVLLGEPDEATRVLPIIIGPAEAQAILMGASGVETPRPMTHDLLIDVIDGLGARLVGVEVTELREGTFFAELVVATAGGEERISARPSDGIALAVRVGCELTVSSAVLDEAAVEVTHDVHEGFTDEEIEDIVGEFHEFLATASPEDFTEPVASGSGIVDAEIIDAEIVEDDDEEDAAEERRPDDEEE